MARRRQPPQRGLVERLPERPRGLDRGQPLGGLGRFLAERDLQRYHPADLLEGNHRPPPRGLVERLLERPRGLDRGPPLGISPHLCSDCRGAVGRHPADLLAGRRWPPHRGLVERLLERPRRLERVATHSTSLTTSATPRRA